MKVACPLFHFPDSKMSEVDSQQASYGIPTAQRTVIWIMESPSFGLCYQSKFSGAIMDGCS